MKENSNILLFFISPIKGGQGNFMILYQTDK